jgi:hypothetical protein
MRQKQPKDVLSKGALKAARAAAVKAIVHAVLKTYHTKSISKAVQNYNSAAPSGKRIVNSGRRAASKVIDIMQHELAAKGFPRAIHQAIEELAKEGAVEWQKFATIAEDRRKALLAAYMGGHSSPADKHATKCRKVYSKYLRVQFKELILAELRRVYEQRLRDIPVNIDCRYVSELTMGGQRIKVTVTPETINRTFNALPLEMGPAVKAQMRPIPEGSVYASQLDTEEIDVVGTPTYNVIQNYLNCIEAGSPRPSAEELKTMISNWHHHSRLPGNDPNQDQQDYVRRGDRSPWSMVSYRWFLHATHRRGTLLLRPGGRRRTLRCVASLQRRRPSVHICAAAN